MKKSRLILFALLIISKSLLAQQQQYPNLYDVEVRSAVALSGVSPFYYYTYVVTNSVRSIGSIDKFEIDISRKLGTLDLDTVGLQFENDGFIEGSFRRHFPFLRGKTTPVGLLASPGHSYGFTWTGGFSNNLSAGWSADSALIEPGRTLSAFEMMSKGLPSIRRCIVSPYFDVIALFPDPADTTITYYVPPVDSVRQAVKCFSWTVGPSAPPVNFIATTWLDTLLSFTRQSAELGWLGRDRDNDCDNDEKPEDGIVRNIEQRLKKAKRELERRDSVLARRELEKLVSKVERLWKRSENDEERKHGKDRKNWWRRDKGDRVVMTSEAYALLKYNTEYLIDRLPDRKPKKGSKEKD